MLFSPSSNLMQFKIRLGRSVTIIDPAEHNKSFDGVFLAVTGNCLQNAAICEIDVSTVEFMCREKESRRIKLYFVFLLVVKSVVTTFLTTTFPIF